MPVSKTPLECYRYYCASQRRVEQWVQDTGHHQLQQSQGSQSNSNSTQQWHGFLEDPCLVTPISMPPPLDKAEADAFHLNSHDLDGVNKPENDVNGNSQRRRGRSASVRKDDHDSIRPRPRTLEDTRISPKDDVTVAPSSSKRSKNSTQSRQTSKGKPSYSSSRKRRRIQREEDGGKANRSTLGYVPYGIVPLLFAMATGSSPMSLAAASIILAGYFCLDYNASIPVLSYYSHPNNSCIYRVKENVPGNRTSQLIFATTRHLFSPRSLSRYPCFMTTIHALCPLVQANLQNSTIA